jgi:hypothetical protein
VNVQQLIQALSQHPPNMPVASIGMDGRMHDIGNIDVAVRDGGWAWADDPAAPTRGTRVVVVH